MVVARECFVPGALDGQRDVIDDQKELILFIKVEQQLKQKDDYVSILNHVAILKREVIIHKLLPSQCIIENTRTISNSKFKMMRFGLLAAESNMTFLSWSYPILLRKYSYNSDQPWCTFPLTLFFSFVVSKLVNVLMTSAHRIVSRSLLPSTLSTVIILTNAPASTNNFCLREETPVRVITCRMPNSSSLIS